MLQLKPINTTLVLFFILESAYSFLNTFYTTKRYSQTNQLSATKSPFSTITIPKIPSNIKPKEELIIDSSRIIKQESSQEIIQTTEKQYNWDFLDAVYLITCDDDTTKDSRLNRVRGILNEIDLLDKVQIIKFETDDEDRVRGCYTSHISVIQKAKNNLLNNKKLDDDLWWRNIFPTSFLNEEKIDDTSEKQKYILVLEDNLSISPNFTPKLLNSISSFLQNEDVNIVHLSYTPFIPNFYIQKTNYNNIIQLNCGDQSALGTTGYILSTNGINTILENNQVKNGYYGKAIPDVMTEIFTSKRYSIYPIPFIRNFDVKSLVNPQLDSLRTVLFIPSVYSLFENTLVFTGLSTNNLLPVFVASVACLSIYSIGYSIDSVRLVLDGGIGDLSFGNAILSIVFGVISIFSLGIIVVGAALAPKPSPNDE